MTKDRPNDERPASEIILYQMEDGTTRLSVRLEGETVWLTQAAMAELFQTTPQNVTIHVKSIYEDGELEAEATCKDYLQVRSEGTRQVERRLKHYNLDVVIAVGYRVRSHRGTQFRRWATERLREYVVKGFAMDDERLKEVRTLGTDYFDELLERIRDIRASEKRFYQKVRDIYKLAIDYDAKAEQTKEFFQIVQNKLHWAITGKTAAEIISERADATKLNPEMFISELSGDLAGDDNPVMDFPNGPSFSDNSYHVVTGNGITDTDNTILDGFTITGGNANVPGPDPLSW